MNNPDSDATLHDVDSTPRRAGLGYWFAVTVALLALVLLGAKTYQWLRADVEQRRAVIQAQLANPDAATAGDADAGTATHASALPALTPVEAGKAVTPDEPAAPAVVGQTVRKCLQEGRLVYTNRPCPEGSTPGTSTVVPSGLARSSTWAGRNQGSEQMAQCNFLRAEIERLTFEFRQPLPPPVLDHISTELTTLRKQQEDLACPAEAGKKAT